MKKVRVLLIAIILILLGGFLASNTYAAKNDIRNLSASLTRPFADSKFTNPKYQYTVAGEATDILYTIVKIYDNNDKVNDVLSYAKALYCLRGGVGFGAEDVSSNPVDYTEIGEMHIDAKDIIENYMNKYKTGNEEQKEIDINTTKEFHVLKTAESPISTEITKTVNLYNAILWIIDESYLPTDKTDGEGKILYDASEYKAELLDKAGVPTIQQVDITDNDIEVIQQLAIWYFINYDEQEAGIKPTVSQSTKYPAQFISIDGDDNVYIENDQRGNNLDRLYQYFIYGAIENADKYQTNETTGARERQVDENKFDKSKQLKITSHDIEGVYDYYEVGPIVFQGNASDNKVSIADIVMYDANGNPVSKEVEISERKEFPGENGETVYGEIKSIGRHIVYKFLDSDGNECTELIKGKEYKIRVYKAFEKGSTIIKEGLYEKYDMSKISLKVASKYNLSTATFLNAGEDSQPVVEIDKEKVYSSDEITTEIKEFDLALRKFIIEKNGVALEVSREPEIDTSKLNTFDERGQKITTAIYDHIKEPLEVEAGDLVKYRLATYNEGDINGYVYSIKDYIPEYLEFVPTAEYITLEELNNYKKLDTLDISDEEKQNLKSKVEAAKYIYEFDTETRILEITKKQIEMPIGPMNYLWMLEAFKGRETLDCKYLDVTFKVSEEFVTDKNMYLTNVATMTYGSKGGTTADEPIIDRDSNKTGEEFTVPTEGQFVSQNKTEYKGNTENQENLNLPEYHYEGQQDDDDFEKLVIKGKEFDLALRKYIMGINGTVPENHRVPQIDTSKLNTIDASTGKEITTATYKHSKEPLTVRQGDIVTYKIRIYNEGKRDGYATKVTDYLPEGLGFLYTSTGDINSDWFLPENVDTKPLYGTDGIYASEEDVLKKVAYKEMFGEDINLGDIQVIQGSKNEDGTRNLLPITAGGTIGESTIKATGLIKAYGSEKQEGDLWQQSTNSEEDGLFYQELEITCIVLKENTYPGILKNVAEITAAEDSEGNQIVNVGDDRDSEPNNVYQDEKHTPGTEVDNYTPGEQDDDDFEPLQLKYFDLALRKFITGVETNGEMENITSRIPAPKFGEDGNIVYEHTKDPVRVANNDTVIYTIRVYNEGTIAGYAEEITDDIPEGLEYLPEHDTNKEYKWVMIDKDGKVTENVEEAEKIVTEYLSEANGKEQNLIAPFDSSKTITTEEPLNPDYRDIKVAFKVKEPNTSDRIIVNSAQISEDSGDDEDSIPDEWNEGEDDQDKEYIYVKYFDLSLLKWVTKTIVTVDGKTTTTVTGFKPNTGKTETTGIRGNEEAEPIAKVVLDKKKLNKTTVKFAYQIRITNEGQIPGYATEITDFIPEGLEFLEEDNKAYGWTKEGENKVTTRALETKLLNPGESAEVEIVFTWKNNEKNLGLKTNIAEITEDYNENNSEDIDSVPDNKVNPYEKEQEDDDDFALVILDIKTGKGASYTLFITSMIALLAAGMYLIKRYVLTY